MSEEITKKDLNAEKRKLNEKRRELNNLEFDLKHTEAELTKLSRELNERELKLKERASKLEKVSLCETAEYRDRQRTALFYLSLVGHVTPEIKKAVTWSLGSILSGCDLPDFGQPKDNTFPTNF